MQVNRLPLRFDPFLLGAQQACLEGSIPLKTMSRLKEASVHPLDANAYVVLQFSRERLGVILLKGHVRASLRAACQRCLSDMEIDINREIELALVRTDAEAGSVQDAFEPFVVTAETVSTSDLIEDELLLSVPAFPVHADLADCDTSMLALLRQDSDVNKVADKASPFAVLEKFRKKDS